jgi:hypothetical protein
LWLIARVAYCLVFLFAVGCKSNTRYTVYRENPVIVCSYSTHVSALVRHFQGASSELQREMYEDRTQHMSAGIA